ncbi:MAG: RNA 2',3'-cyclic phosphodiesterase, partial [Hymenobacteraceae bacterium]|nr:RNA 2',3'-cyclic phosphodiesterase [Hymenobacteraceae bacterium]MDX5397129.1 RNA 2',3'-cyclic phosphodiesterase [Hymenobacteraceae bacterium]MDX5513207.1 RNA 2',3'-cyclic phosphodiesterase [Hymenobacteraceae bacterium]
GKQKLIPHITLARYRKNVPAPPTFAPVVPAEPISYSVNEIAVWQSVLKQPHPEYSILQRFPLQL